MHPLAPRTAGLALLLVAIAAIAGVLVTPRPALALPPAGTDVVPVTAQVSVTTRLGQETIALSGTATIVRGAPYLQGGLVTEDAELTALSMSGMSVTGPITVTESSTKVSSGRIQSLQPSPPEYPASGYFDVYAIIVAPASPSPTITVHNDVPFHLVPTMGSFSRWPPLGFAFGTAPSPCVPLLPVNPMSACITKLIVGFGPNPVGGIAELALPAIVSEPGGRTHWMAMGAAAILAALLVGIILLSPARRRTPRE